MAAISQKAAPDEILPFLARNVFAEGYRRGSPTEFLTLLERYFSQYSELRKLGDADGTLRVENCKDVQPLLMVLGYELKDGCGPKASLIAANQERAFITVDSGFPLADLEETLRGGKPFEYSISAKVPLLFTPADWAENGKPTGDPVEGLLSDPELERVYWSLAKMDPETRESLRRSPGLRRLVPLAATLDFYGGHITIRSGRVIVPGGAAAEASWTALAGASPAAPGEFVTQLLGKDQGWLAAYFDAISRVSQSRQAYFTSPQHLEKFYAALRGNNTNPGPALGVFRQDSNLMLLVTQLQFDAAGQPHVPGDLGAWKEIASRARNGGSRAEQEWARRASGWNSADQLVEGLFGLSRAAGPNSVVPLYLTLSEMDQGRAAGERLTPQTIRLLGDSAPMFGNQYVTFSEFNAVDNAGIARLLTVGRNINRIKDRLLRADAVGILQAEVGLWQILARQGQIPRAMWSASWQRVVVSFASIRNGDQLFQAGRNGLNAIVEAAGGKVGASEEDIIALLAGPNQEDAEGRQVREAIASQIQSVMADQRLVSLNAIFALADGLESKTRSAETNDALTREAGELRAFEMPRPLFTTRERAEWASRFFYNRHAELEMKTDLSKAIETRSAAEVSKAQGALAPFLRDTLVGLNYAYYEPPGAQLLHHNPLFVRFHDFSGGLTESLDEPWQTPLLLGRGDTPSGGAHLAGSLANLPYVLASVEQGMFVPESIQALIWEDLVPDLVASATLPRWWGVSREELHAAALYQRAGEELLAAAAKDEETRGRVMEILSDRILPRRVEMIEEALRGGRLDDALAQTTPAETFYLTADFRQRFPNDTSHWGAAGNELLQIAGTSPEQVSLARLSEDFGVPHPALTQSYARELLDGQLFPSFMSYASRLLAESWDSNNLYWARLADERGYAPVQLNLLVPELTQRMIGKISATHPEDWPAVLRALRETGEEFREGKLAPLPQRVAQAGN